MVFRTPASLGAGAARAPFRAPHFPPSGGSAGAGAPTPGPPGPQGPPGPGAEVTTQTLAASGTAQESDGTLQVNVEIASAAVTVTLPQAQTEDQVVRVREVNGKAGQYPVTVQPNGSDTLNGSTTPWVLDSDFREIEFARTSGGDWVCFADPRNWKGVDVGPYVTRANGSFVNGITLALARNPNAVLFNMPPGSAFDMTQISEAQGLRSNLIFDGLDPRLCTMRRTAAGHMFLWTAAASNIAFRNLTFDFQGISDPFSSSIGVENGNAFTNLTLDRCRFLCSIPDTVTNDGIRHQVNVYGTNIKVTRCYFLSSQLRLWNLGDVSTERAEAFDNDFEDCNDLGVSCVGGDGTGTLKDVRIWKNRFFGVLKGAGYIYVGSDANTTNPSLIQDIRIEQNECRGTIGQLGTDPGSRPASRAGIYVVFGVTTKRVRMNNNTVVNDNPTYDTDNVMAFAMYARKAGVTSVTELEMSDNLADFRCLSDTRGAFNILDLAGDMSGVSGVKMHNNRTPAASGGGTKHRGIVIHEASDVEIFRNRIVGSGSNALLLKASAGHQSDIHIRENELDTTENFFHSVSFQGSKNWTRVHIEHNHKLTQSNGKSVKNEGSGTVDLARYNYNSHTNGGGVDGGLTPTQNTGNQVI